MVHNFRVPIMWIIFAVCTLQNWLAVT